MHLVLKAINKTLNENKSDLPMSLSIVQKVRITKLLGEKETFVLKAAVIENAIDSRLCHSQETTE